MSAIARKNFDRYKPPITVYAQGDKADRIGTWGFRFIALYFVVYVIGYHGLWLGGFERLFR